MPGIRRLVLSVLCVAAVLAPGSPAAAGGDPTEGGRVARRWCTGCHVVDAKATTGTDATPPMPSLMKDPAMTPERLEAFLTKPHGGMAGMSFSRREIDDLVAYIADLAE
jgi:mono/diheme cytochrome c family protein